MKTELIKKIEGFDLSPYASAEEIFGELFEELVPAQGSADTVAGEIIRACARIRYRYFNDGDEAGRGYGMETVNPAVRYLHSITEDERNDFAYTVRTLYDCVNGNYYEYDYQECLEDLIAGAISYIADNRLYNVNNDDDMLSYATDEDIDNDNDY